ncbi:MAG: hypothetical protein ACHP7O_12920 [Burkholderiales bacterium]
MSAGQRTIQGDFQIFDHAPLNNAGLNRQAIFNIDDLPADIAASVRASCPSGSACRQLILVAHAGRKLWQSVKASGIASEDPIDDFTIQTMRQWFVQYQEQNAYEIIYPGDGKIDLQRLGQLAGWHHATPFKVGIDREWGSWFAYRAVLVADTEFEPTRPIESESACATCDDKVCIAACPAGAMNGGQFDLGKCIDYRKQVGSLCKATCLARVSCPVGSIHRYCDEQIHHSYSRSMQAIKLYY